VSEQELELPKGWTNSSLDSLSILITKGSTPTTYGYDYLEKGINFVRVENIIDGQINKNSLKQFISKDAYDYLKRSQLKENDILFSIAGTIGRTTIVTKEDLPANTNQAIALIRCPWEYLETKFIKTILNSPILFNSFSKNRRGVGMDNVGLGDIKEIIVPLPPLNEQKRIVSKIEELLSKIDSTKQSLEQTKLQLELYRQSLLKSIFEGNDVTKSKKSTIGDISDKIFKGIFDLSPNNYTQIGIPLLRISDITQGKLNLSNCKYISKKIHENNKGTTVTPGNIILAKVGASAGSPDKIAIIPIGFETMNINQNLMGIRLQKNLCIPKFVYHWLRYQKNMNKLLGKSKTTTFKSLRNNDLAQLEIFIPTLEEQEQIVSQIEQGFSLIENTQNIVNSTLQTLQTMKMSVLKQAFEGKLVPQDPNDEPAKKLLERIKKEKS